jgi:type I restriction enzyme S subunit
MSDISDSLPLGWTREPIEDLFAPLEDGRTMHQGWSPQCEKEPSPDETQWGVLKTTAIQAGEFQPEHNKLLPSKLDPRPLLEVKPGDILLTCAGPRVRCGVACLVRRTRGRLLISGKMYRFRPKPSVMESGYLEAFLLTEEARQAIDRMKTGGSDSGLNLTHERFRKLLVPVAPLSEQRRIVAEIEKQFTRLEAGVAALKRVQANLKRYRAAVLKAACEGHLVETEAELARKEARDYESGVALLTRILSERRRSWQGRGKYKEPVEPDTAKLGELPEGWSWASPDQVSSAAPYALAIGPFGSNLKVSDYTTSGVPLVFVRNIKSSRFGGDRAVFVSEAKAEELRAHRVSKGDVLITKMGEPPGDACLYPESEPDAVITADCIKLRISPLLTHNRFFVYAINSEVVKPQIKQITKGVAQMKVSLGRFSNLALPLPPLAEQVRIVAEVERRLSVVEGLEAVVAANMKRATRLRQSILQKAFRGELI